MLTLGHRVHQPLRVREVLLEEGAVLRRNALVRAHLRVLLVDPHIRQTPIGQVREVPVLILVVLHDPIGDDRFGRVVHQPTRGRQTQTPQQLQPHVDLVEREPRTRRDLRQAVLHQLLEVLRDQLPRHAQRVRVHAHAIVTLLARTVAQRIDLQQQALTRVTRRDARGLQQQLHRLQGQLPVRLARLQRAQVLTRPLLDLLELAPQVPILIQVGDDHRTHRLDPIAHVRQRPLITELLAQRGPPSRRCRHRLELRITITAAGPRTRQVVVVAPGLGVIRVRVLRRVRVVLGVLVQTRKVVRALGLDVQLSLVRRLPITLQVALDLHDLQRRVRLQLLLDPLAQFRQRHLQDLHRLDHPRRQLHMLAELHLL